MIYISPVGPLFIIVGTFLRPLVRRNRKRNRHVCLVLGSVLVTLDHGIRTKLNLMKYFHTFAKATGLEIYIDDQNKLRDCFVSAHFLLISRYNMHRLSNVIGRRCFRFVTISGYDGQRTDMNAIIGWSLTCFTLCGGFFPH